MLVSGMVLQNRYLILRLLAQGGMGAVYVAKDQRLGHTVALKETLFTEEALRRAFEREARLLAGLRHPALPRVSDHFIEGGGQFLVMEFISGSDLADLMAQRSGPFSTAEVLGWADQLLDALEYIHSQQPPIIHRDIKPQNLKLTEQGRIILLDFGLAKGTPQATRAALSGSILGYTPNFAPLEQIQGTGTDHRSDLYSLGATLYQLLTGMTPPDALLRVTSVVNGRSDPFLPANQVNPLVSPTLAAALMQATSLNCDLRPATAAEMRRELKEIGRNTVLVSPDSFRGAAGVSDPTVPAQIQLPIQRSPELVTAPAEPDPVTSATSQVATTPEQYTTQPAGSVMPTGGEVPLARFGHRFAAFSIDLMILAAASAPVWLARTFREEINLWFAAVIQAAVVLTYSVVMTSLAGQTIGKMLLGIRVVGSRREPPGFGRVVLRETLGKVISGAVVLLGYLSVLWDPSKQGWHDKIARTILVREQAAPRQRALALVGAGVWAFAVAAIAVLLAVRPSALPSSQHPSLLARISGPIVQVPPFISFSGEPAATPGHPKAEISAARVREAVDTAKRKPDDAKAQSDAAVILDTTGDRNQARELIEKAERLSPQDATIAYNHARILYELGRIDEALARLEKAVVWRPIFVDANIFISVIYIVKKDYTAAEAAIAKARKDDPNRIETYTALGAILVFRGMLDDAIKLFNRAKEIDPNNAVALYNLGVAYQVKDDTVNAEQFYKQALAVNPEFKEAQANLTAMTTIATQQQTASSEGAAILSSGNYRHVADNAGTIHHSTWELTVSGNQITGTQVSKERADPLKGRIEGNQVTIERDCSGQGWQGECHQTYRGTIADGIIEGSWSGTGARPSPGKVVWKLYLKPAESK